MAKHSWDFGHTGHSMVPDLRAARAQEHIAHYLDLIEGHLADIAAALAKSGPKDVALSMGLTNIADALKAKT
jgi:hypothetical protein